MERFIRAGIAAAVLGGLLVAAGAAPHGRVGRSSAILRSGPDRRVHRGRSAAVHRGHPDDLGDHRLYLAQADRAGRLGLIAVVACMANMALQTGWIFCDLFAAPSFAHAAPGVLNNPSGSLTAGFMAAWLANISFVLLGIATLRARVLPRTSRLALITVGVITLVPLPADGPPTR